MNTEHTDPIIFDSALDRVAAVAQVMLNRPSVFNALTTDMCRRLAQQMVVWATCPDVQAVLVTAVPGRAFCAGGDIRALYQNRDTKPHLLADFFWHEYNLNKQIHHFKKPFIALLQGLTMGGGAGIAIHGRYRIATERMSFAMPETKIGFFPDVGASYFLNQCPGWSGLYLSLTGNTIDVETAYAWGLVTHFVPEERIEALQSHLIKLEDPSCLNIDRLLQQFSVTPRPSALNQHADTINECFSATSVKSIMQRLDKAGEWAQHTAAQLRQRSPSSLKIAFECYRRAKTLPFDSIMQMEFNVALKYLAGQEFFEGIRALLIDKDQSPRWQSEIPDAAVEEYFLFKGRSLNVN